MKSGIFLADFLMSLNTHARTHARTRTHTHTHTHTHILPCRIRYWD